MKPLRKNVAIGRRLGHIDIPGGLMVNAREISDFADERIVIVSTGLWGLSSSA